DLLEAVPGAKKGSRRAILNDLSPAACHIAYNYCNPPDVAEIRAEFVRIREAVQDEFNWLYGTEHYEPASGLYDPTSEEVVWRLKNSPIARPSSALHPCLEQEATWELLPRAEVERRVGSSALAKTPLPESVESFVCIGVPHEK